MKNAMPPYMVHHLTVVGCCAVDEMKRVVTPFLFAKNGVRVGKKLLRCYFSMVVVAGGLLFGVHFYHTPREEDWYKTIKPLQESISFPHKLLLYFSDGCYVYRVPSLYMFGQNYYVV